MPFDERRCQESTARRSILRCNPRLVDEPLPTALAAAFSGDAVRGCNCPIRLTAPQVCVTLRAGAATAFADKKILQGELS